MPNSTQKKMLASVLVFLVAVVAAAATPAYATEWQVAAVRSAEPVFQAPGLPHEFWGTPPAARAWVVSPPLPPEALTRGGYQSVQVNVDEFGNNIVGDAANEPTIAVDPTNPNVIVIGWRQFDTIESNFRQAGQAYSHDTGRSWTFPGVLDPGVFRSDPVLAADPDGNFYFYSLTVEQNPTLYTCQTFKSTDGGVGWIGPILAYGGDKAWTDIDRTGGIGHGNFYAAWDHAGCCGENWFTRSTDGGMTYMEPIPIPLRPIWGVTTVGPDGAVYIAGRLYETNRNFACVRSSNAQDPLVTPEFEHAVQVDLGGRFLYYVQNSPNPAGLLGQVWIAADHSDGPTRGNLYMLSSVDPPGDDPLDIMFCRSTDRGETWTDPIRINDDPVGTCAWQWFGTLSVAPNGRLDVVWNDTRNSGEVQISEVFYSHSTDAGETWSTNEPITPPFNSHLGWPQQNKLGDYNDMVSDTVGVNLAYAATFNGEQDVYFLRIGDYDCNGNGVGDSIDIANGTSTDFNGNGIPDECEGLADLNCDGLLDAFDIDPFVLALTDPEAYAAAYPNCDIDAADINGDGTLDAFDIDPFVQLLTAG